MGRVTLIDIIPFLALMGFFLLGLYGSEQGGGGEFYLMVVALSGIILITGWLGMYFRDWLFDLWGDLLALKIRRARARLRPPQYVNMESAFAAVRKRDWRNAATVFWLLAEQGEAQAQYSLAILFRYGYGVPRSREEMLYWLAHAARRGVVAAQAELGAGYFGTGRLRNVIEGMRWLETAAQQGHQGAQIRLGDLYAEGRDIERDPQRAARWYRLAAEKGHVLAQRALGQLYMYGQGVPRDRIQAYAWLRLAAEHGDGVAARMLNKAGSGLDANERVNSDWLVCAWQDKITEAPRLAAHKKQKAEQRRLTRERGRMGSQSVIEQIRAAMSATENTPLHIAGLNSKTDVTSTPEVDKSQIDVTRGIEDSDHVYNSTKNKSTASEAKAFGTETDLDQAIKPLPNAQQTAANQNKRLSLTERLRRLGNGSADDKQEPITQATTSNDLMPSGSRSNAQKGEDSVEVSDAARAAQEKAQKLTNHQPERETRRRLEASAKSGSVLAERMKGKMNSTADDEPSTSPSLRRNRTGAAGRLNDGDRSALVAERLANMPKLQQHNVSEK